MNTSFPSFRPLLPTDEPFLWEMLYQALFVPPGAVPFPREIIRQPEISRYVAGWGRPTDSGFIAENAQQAMGAVWIRLLTGNDKGYGYIDDETPELTIALLPEFRNQGIGRKLMTQMLSHAENFFRAVCLSVSTDNPALHLYRKLGFETVKEDGASLTMVRKFD